MGISDRIETFICELLKADDGWVELGRNELAGIKDCVPSQINYVIRTRFTPERGYVVESRRGGGGYLKIRRISDSGMSQLEAIGNSISYADAVSIIDLLCATGVLSTDVARVTAAAMEDEAIKRVQDADVLRASLLRTMLSEAIKL